MPRWRGSCGSPPGWRGPAAKSPRPRRHSSWSSRGRCPGSWPRYRLSSSDRFSSDPSPGRSATLTSAGRIRRSPIMYPFRRTSRTVFAGSADSSVATASWRFGSKPPAVSTSRRPCFRHRSVSCLWMRRMPWPKSLSRSAEEACESARSKLSTTGRNSRARSAKARRRDSAFSRSLLLRRFSNSASLRRWRSFSSSRSFWTDFSFSSAAAIADRSSSSSAESSDSPVSSTRMRSSSSISSRRSRSTIVRLPPPVLAALQPLGERAAEELDDRNHSRILAPRRPDDSQHPGQSLARPIRGQHRRQPRIGREARLRSQHDAGFPRIEVSRDQIEQARLLVECAEDLLQAFHVGELRLVEQLRGAVDVDALFPFPRVECEPREIESTREHPIARRPLFGDLVEKAAPHVVERPARVLPAESLARVVELAGRVVAAGLDDPGQDHVRLVDLHDEDFPRRYRKEPQRLQNGVERVGGHDEADFAREP